MRALSIVVIVASCMLALGVVLMLFSLKGPTFYNVRLGVVTDGQHVFRVAKPEGWFAGFVLTTDHEPLRSGQELNLSLEIGGQLVATTQVTGDDLRASNWINGRGQIVPMKETFTNLSLREIDSGVQLDVTAIGRHFQGRQVDLWMRFVDDRRIKESDSGIITVDNPKGRSSHTDGIGPELTNAVPHKR